MGYSGKSMVSLAILALTCSFWAIGCKQEQSNQESSPDGCALPSGLREEISKRYPGSRVVRSADLDQYYRRMYQRGHGTRCPGLVKVDFYGDGNPTWALVLIAGENPKRKAELVVARQVADGWETRLLETTDGTPVIWRDEPGVYEDMYGEKTLRAQYPVIVFVGYESWAIVFGWTGTEVVKVWIAD